MNRLFATFSKLLLIIGVTFFCLTSYSQDDMMGGGETRTRKRTVKMGTQVGLSYMSAITDNASLPSFTLLTPMGPKSALQFFTKIASTSPFAFSIAAAYKHTLTGTQKMGLHGGFSAGFGSRGSGQTFITAGGLLGFHFRYRKRIFIHVDGGAVFKNLKAGGGGGSTSSITLGGNSTIYGISLLYML